MEGVFSRNISKFHILHKKYYIWVGEANPKRGNFIILKGIQKLKLL